MSSSSPTNAEPRKARSKLRPWAEAARLVLGAHEALPITELFERIIERGLRDTTPGSRECLFSMMRAHSRGAHSLFYRHVVEVSGGPPVICFGLRSDLPPFTSIVETDADTDDESQKHEFRYKPKIQLLRFQSPAHQQQQQSQGQPVTSKHPQQQQPRQYQQQHISTHQQSASVQRQQAKSGGGDDIGFIKTSDVGFNVVGSAISASATVASSVGNGGSGCGNSSGNSSGSSPSGRSGGATGESEAENVAPDDDQIAVLAQHMQQQQQELHGHAFQNSSKRKVSSGSLEESLTLPPPPKRCLRPKPQRNCSEERPAGTASVFGAELNTMGLTMTPNYSSPLSPSSVTAFMSGEVSDTGNTSLNKEQFAAAVAASLTHVAAAAAVVSSNAAIIGEFGDASGTVSDIELMLREGRVQHHQSLSQQICHQQVYAVQPEASVAEAKSALSALPKVPGSLFPLSSTTLIRAPLTSIDSSNSHLFTSSVSSPAIVPATTEPLLAQYPPSTKRFSNSQNANESCTPSSAVPVSCLAAGSSQLSSGNISLGSGNGGALSQAPKSSGPAMGTRGGTANAGGNGRLTPTAAVGSNGGNVSVSLRNGGSANTTALGGSSGATGGFQTVREMLNGLSELFGGARLSRRPVKKMTLSQQLEESKRGLIDLETPDSILAGVNIKELLSPATFALLPLHQQRRLFNLLPQVERRVANNRLNRSAASTSSSMSASPTRCTLVSDGDCISQLRTSNDILSGSNLSQTSTLTNTKENSMDIFAPLTDLNGSGEIAGQTAGSVVPSTSSSLTEAPVISVESALNNEFFASACQEWRERLMDGELTPESQLKQKADYERHLRAVDPWKRRHFEKIWGIPAAKRAEMSIEERIQLIRIRREHIRSVTQARERLEDKSSEKAISATPTEVKPEVDQLVKAKVSVKVEAVAGVVERKDATPANAETKNITKLSRVFASEDSSQKCHSDTPVEPGVDVAVLGHLPPTSQPPQPSSSTVMPVAGDTSILSSDTAPASPHKSTTPSRALASPLVTETHATDPANASESLIQGSSNNITASSVSLSPTVSVVTAPAALNTSGSRSRGNKEVASTVLVPSAATASSNRRKYNACNRDGEGVGSPRRSHQQPITRSSSSLSASSNDPHFEQLLGSSEDDLDIRSLPQQRFKTTPVDELRPSTVELLLHINKDSSIADHHGHGDEEDDGDVDYESASDVPEEELLAREEARIGLLLPFASRALLTVLAEHGAPVSANHRRKCNNAVPPSLCGAARRVGLRLLTPPRARLPACVQLPRRCVGLYQAISRHAPARRLCRAEARRRFARDRRRLADHLNESNGVGVDRILSLPPVPSVVPVPLAVHELIADLLQALESDRIPGGGAAGFVLAGQSSLSSLGGSLSLAHALSPSLTLTMAAAFSMAACGANTAPSSSPAYPTSSLLPLTSAGLLAAATAAGGTSDYGGVCIGNGLMGCGLGVIPGVALPVAGGSASQSYATSTVGTPSHTGTTVGDSENFGSELMFSVATDEEPPTDMSDDAIGSELSESRPTTAIDHMLHDATAACAAATSTSPAVIVESGHPCQEEPGPFSSIASISEGDGCSGHLVMSAVPVSQQSVVRAITAIGCDNDNVTMLSGDDDDTRDVATSPDSIEKSKGFLDTVAITRACKRQLQQRRRKQLHSRNDRFSKSSDKERANRPGSTDFECSEDGQQSPQKEIITVCEMQTDSILRNTTNSVYQAQDRNVQSCLMAESFIETNDLPEDKTLKGRESPGEKGTGLTFHDDCVSTAAELCNVAQHSKYHIGSRALDLEAEAPECSSVAVSALDSTNRFNDADDDQDEEQDSPDCVILDEENFSDRSASSPEIISALPVPTSLENIKSSSILSLRASKHLGTLSGNPQCSEAHQETRDLRYKSQLESTTNNVDLERNVGSPTSIDCNQLPLDSTASCNERQFDCEAGLSRTNVPVSGVSSSLENINAAALGAVNELKEYESEAIIDRQKPDAELVKSPLLQLHIQPAITGFSVTHKDDEGGSCQSNNGSSDNLNASEDCADVPAVTDNATLTFLEQLPLNQGSGSGNLLALPKEGEPSGESKFQYAPTQSFQTTHPVAATQLCCEAASAKTNGRHEDHLPLVAERRHADTENASAKLAAKVVTVVDTVAILQSPPAIDRANFDNDDSFYISCDENNVQHKSLRDQPSSHLPALPTADSANTFADSRSQDDLLPTMQYAAAEECEANVDDGDILNNAEAIAHQRPSESHFFSHRQLQLTCASVPSNESRITGSANIPDERATISGGTSSTSEATLSDEDTDIDTILPTAATVTDATADNTLVEDETRNCGDAASDSTIEDADDELLCGRLISGISERSHQQQQQQRLLHTRRRHFESSQRGQPLERHQDSQVFHDSQRELVPEPSAKNDFVGSDLISVQRQPSTLLPDPSHLQERHRPSDNSVNDGVCFTSPPTMSEPTKVYNTTTAEVMKNPNETDCKNEKCETKQTCHCHHENEASLSNNLLQHQKNLFDANELRQSSGVNRTWQSTDCSDIECPSNTTHFLHVTSLCATASSHEVGPVNWGAQAEEIIETNHQNCSESDGINSGFYQKSDVSSNCNVVSHEDSPSILFDQSSSQCVRRSTLKESFNQGDALREEKSKLVDRNLGSNRKTESLVCPYYAVGRISDNQDNNESFSKLITDSGGPLEDYDDEVDTSARPASFVSGGSLAPPPLPPRCRAQAASSIAKVTAAAAKAVGEVAAVEDIARASGSRRHVRRRRRALSCRDLLIAVEQQRRKARRAALDGPSAASSSMSCCLLLEEQQQQDERRFGCGSQAQPAALSSSVNVNDDGSVIDGGVVMDSSVTTSCQFRFDQAGCSHTSHRAATIATVFSAGEICAGDLLLTQQRSQRHGCAHRDGSSVRNAGKSSSAGGGGGSGGSGCLCRLQPMLPCQRCGAFWHSDCIGPSRICSTCLLA